MELSSRGVSPCGLKEVLKRRLEGARAGESCLPARKSQLKPQTIRKPVTNATAVKHAAKKPTGDFDSTNVHKPVATVAQREAEKPGGKSALKIANKTAIATDSGVKTGAKKKRVSGNKSKMAPPGCCLM